jgi:hypothetical protein
MKNEWNVFIEIPQQVCVENFEKEDYGGDKFKLRS